MSPVVKVGPNGRVSQVSSEEMASIERRSANLPRPLVVAQRVVRDLSGAMIGLGAGLVPTGGLEYISQQTIHESILSNPTSLVLTAIILLGTTALGAIMADALGRYR